MSNRGHRIVFKELSMKITINKAMVDYWTLTTFDQVIFENWHMIMRGEGCKYEKRKRYEGDRGEGGMKSVFVGVGTQKGKKHYVAECSGASADMLLGRFVNGETIRGRINCTRIDVQVTIEEPASWNQIDYESAAESAGLKPTKCRSADSINTGLELMTVYTGTRESGRFNRVYEKVMESGERLLRFETQFGRGYAKAVCAGILNGRRSEIAIVRGEIARRGIKELDVFDLWTDQIFIPKEEKRIEVDKRVLWLVADILPVFAEYINRHDADPRVVEMFARTIAQSGTGCELLDV